MTMQPPCFTCRTRPAGNDYAGPCSAYCSACQPRDSRPPRRGAQCRCAACGVTLATLTDFDAHQVYAAGVFTGECLDPAALGLELAGRVFGTPAGNANRARKDTALIARAASPRRELAA